MHEVLSDVTSFNSNLVRLSAQKGLIALAFAIGFNSNLVRLSETGRRTELRHHQSFNSNLVRLSAFEPRIFRAKRKKFQFQSGAIKRGWNDTRSRSGQQVLIPIWCD